jgi:lipopolysaccharide/colanic/teichoic acid biosynthesis glycosyltransferase
MYRLTGNRIGFLPRSAVAYRIFNLVLSSALFFLLLPVAIFICVLLLLTQGRDVFYCGWRLGKDRKPFRILKFRTLCSRRAKSMTRNCTLPRDADILTPLGRVLRDSRLDELPQLLNVLMGDMNICGPRPVRQEIAAIEQKRIPNYHLRFAVKPGLIGPTQAYFGHGASKRVRARMNNILVKRPVSLSAELALLGRIGLSILKKTVHNVMGTAFGRPLGAAQRLRRDMWVVCEGDDRLWPVQEIGMRRIKVGAQASGSGLASATLYIRLRSGALRKARIVLSPSQSFGVLNYAAETEFGEFVVERYALGLVVVPPAIGTQAVGDERTHELEKAWA